MEGQYYYIFYTDNGAIYLERQVVSLMLMKASTKILGKGQNVTAEDYKKMISLKNFDIIKVTNAMDKCGLLTEAIKNKEFGNNLVNDDKNSLANFAVYNLSKTGETELKNLREKWGMADKVISTIKSCLLFTPHIDWWSIPNKIAERIEAIEISKKYKSSRTFNNGRSSVVWPREKLVKL